MDKYISHLAGTRQTIPASLGKTAKPTKTSLSFEQLLNEQNRPSASEPLLVGEISNQQKTVSELLMQNPALKKSTWNILASQQNRDKNYTKLPIGTRIYYNADQKTLSWETPGQGAKTAARLTAELARPPVSPIFPLSSTTIEQVQASSQESQPNTSVPLPLGQISEKLPTISHLLKADPGLGPEAWNILSAPANRNKDFTNLPVGAKVHLDPATREISWNSSTRTGTDQVNRTEAMPSSRIPTFPAEQATLLGKIDRVTSTVSHLLSQQPELKDRIWQLLSNAANKGKPFHRIPSGTPIYLQPDSGEISWQNQAASPVSTPAPEKIATIAPPAVKKLQQNGPATDLTEAVQPFLGSSYKDINCYELLVKGLDRMDIPYGGKDGLYSKLQNMALDKGLPANAYLNGEGIVKAAGSLVLSRNFPSNSNWQKQSAALFEEMKPLLDKGQILSFSTRRRGHTGIISQQDKQWTFINSGRLDNSLAANNISKGVGEEDLHKELANWFKLAHKSKETLTVTLGQLTQQKVAAAFTMGESIAKRI